MTAGNSNIIAIASGKGGVGKTWLSITLAHLLARSGRSVLLFDGDIGLANIDVQLGLTPGKDLGGATQGKYTLADAVTTYAEGGFDIVAGRSGSASLAALSKEKMAALGGELHELAKKYDIVLIDLGAGIEQHVQALTSFAGRCLVVATDEPTSLTDAYAFIKITTQYYPQVDLGIVINQAATQKEAEQTYQSLNRACTNFLKINPPLMGLIRRDNKVRDSIRAQTSIIAKAPHTTAATDVAALAVKLMQK